MNFLLIMWRLHLMNLQLETLLKLFPVLSYRNLALQCLSEVGLQTLDSVRVLVLCSISGIEPYRINWLLYGLCLLFFTDAPRVGAGCSSQLWGFLWSAICETLYHLHGSAPGRDFFCSGTLLVNYCSYPNLEIKCVKLYDYLSMFLIVPTWLGFVVGFICCTYTHSCKPT